MPRLILASSSVYRAALLKRLRVPFESLAHRVDERDVQAPTLDALALKLADAKARSVAEPGAFVIGGDQLVDLDGQVLGKPGTAAAACEQLARLSGRSHRLVTATALVTPEGALHQDLHIHTMTLRALGQREIERYVEVDQPLDCCGSYRIESLGISLFATIEGEDPTAIEGLPLLRLSGMLRRAGFEIP